MPNMELNQNWHKMHSVLYLSDTKCNLIRPTLVECDRGGGGGGGGGVNYWRGGHVLKLHLLEVDNWSHLR